MPTRLISIGTYKEEFDQNTRQYNYSREVCCCVLDLNTLTELTAFSVL